MYKKECEKLFNGWTDEAYNRVIDKNNLLEYLSNQQPEVLVTIGAGDIDQFVIPIGNLFEKAR